MINLPETTKNQYKDFNREIKTFGNLYIANKRVSKNLFNIRELTLFDVHGTSSIEYSTGIITLTDLYHSSNQTLSQLCPEMVAGETYVISFLKEPDTTNNYIYLTGSQYTWWNGTPHTVTQVEMDSVIVFYGGAYQTTTTYTIRNIQIEKGSSPRPYEEYGIIVSDYNSLYKQSKNLFNINGQINVKGNNGNIEEGKNTVLGNVLTTNVNTTNEHGYGQKFTDLNGKTITFSAKLLSLGYGTKGVLLIYSNNSIVATKEIVNVNEYGYITYTCNSNNIVFAFGTSQGTQAQFTNIQIEIGNSRTLYEPYNKLSSCNLFDINGNVYVKGTSNSDIGMNNIVSNNILTTNYNSSLSHGYGQVFNGLIGQTFTFSAKCIDNGTSTLGGKISIYDNNSLVRNIDILKGNYGSITYTATSNNIICAFSTASGTGAKFTDIQVQIGNARTPYERYNSTPFKLNTDNQCEILSFNINEKTDIYYTSVPHNSMTIEVNNEQGYFTDFDDRSLNDKLNNECYVDLYLKINEDSYYKIMTMDFDKISYSDYKTAKLNFYSCLTKLNIEEIKDKNKAFNNQRLTYLELNNFLLNNYNINANVTNTNSLSISAINLKTTYFNNLKSMLTTAGSNISLESGAEALITSNYNNTLLIKELTNTSLETITKDYQIEKPTMKKENTYAGYKFVYQDHYFNTNYYEQTTETYTKTIIKSLQSKRDVFILLDNQYKLNDITTSDITVTGNVTVSLGENTYSNNKILIFIVEGNIGEQYTIEINKSNIYKLRTEKNTTQDFGNVEDSSKIIIKNENSSVGSGVPAFLFIKKPIEAYVEVKLMCLPYIEIGDTIRVELDNITIKIIVTENTINFDTGLTQTIKGYKLEWEHQAPSPLDMLNNWTEE